MGLDALLAKLDADARQEREEILSRAERRAEALRAQADAELKRARTRALDDVRAREEAAARKQIAEARTEARRIVFQARHDLLCRIRAAAEERIDGALQDDTYRSALRGEVDAALRRAPSGPLRLRAAPDLAKALRDLLVETGTAEGPGRPGASGPGEGAGTPPEGAPVPEVVADDEVGTGFLVFGAEGAVIIDATLSARLERAWPAETMRLLEELGS